MPEPPPFWKMLGPGVVMAGVGLSSAEYILWPYMTSRVGPGFLWVAVVVILTQFFVNMEAGRYALATGESAVTGFARLWRPWGIAFALLAILANAWPGLAAGSATAVVLAYDLGDGAVVPIAVASLIVIGAVLTLSPVVYRTVERIQFFKVGAVLVFLALALILGIGAWDWQDLSSATVEGASDPLGVIRRAEEIGRLPEGLSAVTLVGLLAFAGAGGCANLALGNWMRDKGFGMGAYAPRLTSPITGEVEASDPPAGYTFPRNEENLSRWRVWWRNANREHFVGFFVVGTASVLIFSMLAYATLYNLQTGPGFDFVLVQGAVLSGVIAPWFGTSFWVVGAIALLAANLGIMDYVGRLAADGLRTSLLAESRFWSEGRIYATTVWAVVVFGCLVLLGGLAGPVELILVSAALGVLAMSVYPALLISLNRKALPAEIQPGRFRLGAMAWATLLFGSLSLLLIANRAGAALGLA